MLERHLAFRPASRRRSLTFFAAALLVLAVACGAEAEPESALSTAPEAGATEPPPVTDASAPPPQAASDGGVDAGSARVCKAEHATLGMACLQVNDQVCPTGDGACYGISLRNVCGPKDRGCSLTAPTCAGAGQTCRAPLRAGSPEGICLTDDEAVCFCGNIGVSLRPPFCPIADDERPGTGGICRCPSGEYCVSEPGRGPCRPGLACIRGGCRGAPCTDDDGCAANEVCMAYASFDGQILGKACSAR